MRYLVNIGPGPEHIGTVIHIPALDYETVWPENGNDISRILIDLITDLSGRKPTSVIPAFHVLAHKLTDHARELVAKAKENPITISYRNRDLADVLQGVVDQLAEVDVILTDAQEAIRAEEEHNGTSGTARD